MKKLGVFLLALSLTPVVQAQELINSSSQHEESNDKPSLFSKMAQKNILNHLDVGVGVGTLGIGIDVAAPIGDYVRVRAGYNYMPSFNFHSSFTIETSKGSISNLLEKVGKIDEKLAEHNRDINDEAFADYKEMFDKFKNIEVKDYVTMGLKPNLHQFKFLVDVMPFKNNKHWSFTTGFFVGPPDVGDACNLKKETLILEAINQYNSIYANYPDKGINGIHLSNSGDPNSVKEDPFYKYGLAGFNLGTFADGDKAMMIPGKDNTVRAEMKVNKFRPYLGFGYNTHLSKDKKWNLNVDAGILILCGKPKVYVDNVYKFDASALKGHLDEDGFFVYESGIGSVYDVYPNYSYGNEYYGEIVRYYYDPNHTPDIWYDERSDVKKLDNVDLTRDLHDIPGEVGSMVHTISKFKVYPNASVTFSYKLF